VFEEPLGIFASYKKVKHDGACADAIEKTTAVMGRGRVTLRPNIRP
jgi:hypothetical protein